jgi:hypothetical protein
LGYPKCRDTGKLIWTKFVSNCRCDDRKTRAKGDDYVKRFEVRGWFEETGIIAAVRVTSAEDALFAAGAVAGGGVVVIEIPLTVPQAVKVIPS